LLEGVHGLSVGLKESIAILLLTYELMNHISEVRVKLEILKLLGGVDVDF
jgi:hypothetical protein